MNIKFHGIFLAAVVSIAACMPAPAAASQTTSTYTPTTYSIPRADPTPVETAATQPRVIDWELEIVARNLEVPWSIAFTGAERLLVAERAGRIREVVEGSLRDEPLFTLLDIAAVEESGLMGLALDPDYGSNRYIFACYTYSGSSGLMNRVARLRDLGERIEMDAVIIDDIPSAKYHAGCRLGFGPDGKLYVTTGDALQPQAAQELDSLAGKILRLNPDGSIPADNPFQGSAVYSLGHRNPQGISWNPENGLLYASEHGPSGFDGPQGGDEVNLILAGANYGWPLVSHDETRAGTQNPLRQFTPAIAPAAILVYPGDELPMFTGKLLLGALRGEGLAALTLAPDDPAQVTNIEWLVQGLGRVREVTVGPDGLVYFSTSNRDGRGSARAGDDKIYRIVPVYE